MRVTTTVALAIVARIWLKRNVRNRGSRDERKWKHGESVRLYRAKIKGTLVTERFP